VIASLAALVVLVRLLPHSVRGMGLGRIASAIVAGMVLLVTLWFVSLPFSLADLWWQHHWGLGPFDVLSWLAAQWSTLGPEVVFLMGTIVLLVGLAGRFRRWWLVAAPVVVAIAALFAFVSGWLASAASHPLHDPVLAADARRLERIEHVRGTPVRVQDVSSWTDQANAFTVGFGPSTHVVLWDTLLDGRFSRGEEDVVIAHELGHVRSRHILKALGWTALLVLPTLWLLDVVVRRRGGVGDPANLPYVILVLTVLSLLTAPVQNAVSRRYEAEADWRALNATRDPASDTRLFQSFGRTSLEQPNPPLLDYLWLENHPTLMQRIAMAQQWRFRAAATAGRSSRGGPGSP
jgi:STE24 endopeptidase